MARRSDGITRMAEMLIKQVQPIIKSRPLDPEMFSSLFGGPEPKRQESPQLDPSERYWIDWFERFTEISASLDRLNECAGYLTHIPSARHLRFYRVTEASWLRYHIEMYMQEVYILENRLQAFFRRLQRRARRVGDTNGERFVNSLLEMIQTGFSNVRTTRGKHVHRSRMYDTELRDLDTLVLLTTAGRLRKLRPLRQIRFQIVRAKWRTKLSDNNREMRQFCSQVFDLASPFLVRYQPGSTAQRKNSIN